MQSREYGHETRGKGDILVGIQLLYVLFAPVAQLNRAPYYGYGGFVGLSPTRGTKQ